MMNLIRVVTTVILLATCLASGQSATQDDSLEQEIRKLDQANVEAVLHSDLAALEKLWAEDFTVNAPSNQVIKGKTSVLERVRAGLIKYSSFVAEIESVVIHGDTAIVMGLETVKPIGNAPRAGETLRPLHKHLDEEEWSMAVDRTARQHHLSTVRGPACKRTAGLSGSMRSPNRSRSIPQGLR